jgi:hypothetical protein
VVLPDDGGRPPNMKEGIKYVFILHALYVEVVDSLIIRSMKVYFH